MDSDTKAVLDLLFAESDDPMGELVANLGQEGNLPPGLVIRSMCNSNALDIDPGGFDAILRRIDKMERKEASQSKLGPLARSDKPGPSTPRAKSPSENK
ncbi:hypothetical protein FRC09_000020 [Ceratobasidium sp. 395]|nr:hypothetical protein FRC09_000020 [Ceratobasidium sp. 395]